MMPPSRDLTRRDTSGRLLVGVEGDEPPPLQCDRCSGEVCWTWWDLSGRGIPSRWMRPRPTDGKGLLCTECKELSEAEEHAAIVDKKLKRWGVPTRARAYSFDRSIRQGFRGMDGSCAAAAFCAHGCEHGHRCDADASRPEGFEHFRGRVESARPAVIGLTAHNVRAARAFRDFDPRRGRWLLLSGKTGTGKTTFLAALARKLAEVPDGWEVLDGDGNVRSRFYRGPGRRLRRRGYSGVAYVPEHQLQQEYDAWTRRGWRDRSADADPFKRLEGAQVALVDDIGSANVKPDWKARIGAWVDRAYQEGRTIVMTSNHPLSQLETMYGPRTASRLIEKCDVFELDLTDWRRVAATEPGR